MASNKLRSISSSRGNIMSPKLAANRSHHTLRLPPQKSRMDRPSGNSTRWAGRFSARGRSGSPSRVAQLSDGEPSERMVPPRVGRGFVSAYILCYGDGEEDVGKYVRWVSLWVGRTHILYNIDIFIENPPKSKPLVQCRRKSSRESP